jgi:hypothetical protein
MATQNEKKIVNGPCREELFDALRLGATDELMSMVSFKSETDVFPHVITSVFITGLSYDPCKPVVGEEGHIWSFTGQSQRYGRVSGTYNTKRRVGILRYESQP